MPGPGLLVEKGPVPVRATLTPDEFHEPLRMTAVPADGGTDPRFRPSPVRDLYECSRATSAVL